MNYQTLKANMHWYRMGQITRDEMISAIGLWQASLTGGFVATGEK